MSSEKLWYVLMTSIFIIVSIATVTSIFMNMEGDRSFPRHVFIIGLGFGVWSIFEWRKGRERYPYAYLVTLCALYAFVLVISTTVRSGM